MKRRPLPICNSIHETMLERIDMHVIDEASEIPFVANRVLEESTLPDAMFALAFATRRYVADGSADLQPRSGESGFDVTPP